ncbi:hypothetical protein GGF48_003156 [Coemansia sp. RSA 921]|nr:hypothetical protein GGF48_003156 [Coemansia sp. RSA 921]
MQAGVSFHPDGEFAAVAQRRDLRDYIGVYSTQDWRLVRELALDTADVQGMRWSPDGLHIVAWDTSASFVVQVLNVGGAVKRSVQPADAGLGVRTCVWSPNGQFVVLGGYDGRLHVLSSLTWRAVATLEPKPHISIPTDVFCETELPRALSASRIHTRFDLATIPCMLKTGGKSHKTCVEFSADGSLLCAVNESMPCTVWVWQVRTMRVSAIIQTLHPVRVCVWSPVENVLVFATGAASVYLWRENRGCHLFEIPAASVAVGGVPDYTMDEPLFGGTSRREMVLQRFASAFLVTAASATLSIALVQAVRTGVFVHALLGVCVALFAAIEVRLVSWYRRGDLEPGFRHVIAALGLAIALLCIVANLYFFTINSGL